MSAVTARTYEVASVDDPARVYRVIRPTISPLVFRLRAADHVAMSEDQPELGELRGAPLSRIARPSFWRAIAIHAAAKVLVRLVNPVAIAAELDEHLQKDAGRDVRRVVSRPHRLLVDGRPLEILADGHLITLRLHRGSTKARGERAAEPGRAA